MLKNDEADTKVVIGFICGPFHQPRLNRISSFVCAQTFIICIFKADLINILKTLMGGAVKALTSMGVTI